MFKKIKITAAAAVLSAITATIAAAVIGCGERTHFNPNIEYDTFVDFRDGGTYRTIRIGSLTWMAENLNFEADSSWCFRNVPSNCDTYGRLYNWSAAMNISHDYLARPWKGADAGHQGVCPAGWRLPSDADWTNLVNVADGSTTAGKRLKALAGWRDNGNGIDVLGFAAMPGGVRWGDRFLNVGFFGGWWSATEHDAANSRFRLMYNNYEGVSNRWLSKNNGFAVRCVRD